MGELFAVVLVLFLQLLDLGLDFLLRVHAADLRDRQGEGDNLDDEREQNDGEAVKWFRRAAEQGSAVAQNNLGVMYLNERGVARDDAETVKWFRQAAGKGNADAQNNLGVMFMDGKGVPRDYAVAVKWFRRAAEQGNAEAQFNLGLTYRNGEGVVRDDAEAVKWFIKAARQNLSSAQFTLGLIYEEGKGVKQDTTEAVEWYRKAAQQGEEEALNNLIAMGNRGNSIAQFNLGVMYEEGDGVGQDDAEAAKWYRRAAEQEHENALNRLMEMCNKGIAVAQFNLGGMYQDGEGVAQDNEEAAKWYRKAAEQGHATAKLRLDKIKRK